MLRFLHYAWQRSRNRNLARIGKTRIASSAAKQAGMPALRQMTEWNQRRRLARDEMRIAGVQQWYSRGYLPHFDEEGLTQTLTFRLFDSMPQEILDLGAKNCTWFRKRKPIVNGANGLMPTLTKVTAVVT